MPFKGMGKKEPCAQRVYASPLDYGDDIICLCLSKLFPVGKISRLDDVALK